MKAFSKKVWVLCALLLVAVGLAVGVIWSWLSVEDREKNVTAFTTTIDRLLSSSKLKYADSQSGLAVDLEREVVQPVKELQEIASALAEGEAMDGLYVAKLDAQGQILAKTAMMDALRLTEAVQSQSDQVESQFLALENSFKQLKQLYLSHHQQAVATRRLLSWVSLALLASVSLVVVFVIMQQQKENELQKVKMEATTKSEEERVARLKHFIEAMAAGKYDEQVQNESDELSETLVSMRDKLKHNAEEEQRRSWSNTGLAKIGEILRDTTQSTVLYDSIIKFLVKYTGSNQGGLFILNDADTQHHHLELVAYYAFERKKYLQKKVDIGEGLVGQSFLEGEAIHLTEVPEEFALITSGLGGDKPTSVLVMPLKVNETIVGVLELASFKTYPEHAIALVQKFAESIASTISAVKVNDTTRMLLAQTQEQAEEMRAQEEEMRQNMEELSATQEQMMRQMKETEELKEQLRQREQVFSLTTILSESDKFGTITFLNDKLVEVSKYSREELMGKAHNIFRHPDMPKELFRLFWSTIQQGKVFQGVIKNKAKDGTHYWVDATVVPVKNQQGDIIKYVSARYHIKNDQIAEDLYEKQAKRLGLPQLQSA